MNYHPYNVKYPMTTFQQVVTLFLTAATALVPLYIAVVNAMQKRKYDHFEKALEDNKASMALVQANYETLLGIMKAKDGLIDEQAQTLAEQRTVIETFHDIEKEVHTLRAENAEMKITIIRLTADKLRVEEQLNHYLKL